MDVGVWLGNLGLGQYEAAFRDNEIDGAVLPKLTLDDLKDLGVAVVGHRRKIMSAIEELNIASVARAAAMKPRQTQAPSSVVAGSDGAERRPITVMFCDLVGSTSLAARLDAEDWRNLVGAYLDEASTAVTGLGGHVLKKLGDGLMALFGYPQAQENDAERAVRAALAIQRALADLNARNVRSGAPELSARIGIECGSVVIDAAGEVFGEAPNVAARVQAAAEPGTVLVTASVQRQTAGLFVVEDKGAHDLKGVPAPVTLYRIVRASGGGRRGGARALTPLVGREDELALLTRRWARAIEGEGQFVQIVGEPGIGKSRLVEEFRAKLAETPHTWVEWAASQLLQNTPLHPLAEWGRLRFGGADATDEGRLADLETTLTLIGLNAAEYAPLLAPLVDIPLGEDRRAKFPPEELRRLQLAAMTAWVLAGARSQPVVLAFEDLHWADPTSLDLMARLAERGAQSPLLVVTTTRPEFRAPWAMRSHHGVVSLAPLDRAQVRKMVGEIASRHALSDEMIDGVGERTGGVPLFVEEVTRLLLERNAKGGAQAIPPTLQQSLAARLDRLGEAREVAQIGAVLGRDFSYRLLQAVAGVADRGPVGGVADRGSVGGVGDRGSVGGVGDRALQRGAAAPVAAVADRGPPGHAGLSEAALQAALDRLTEADLLFADGAPPTAVYRFKHALIQDAAYESLLKSRRQALHRRAAEALRDANAEPEAIAHHFTGAGLDDLAIEWWGRAGDQALRRSAFQEAIAHLGKAIAMADRVGETGATSQRLKLQTGYGMALTYARGAAAEESKAAAARTAELAAEVYDPAARFAVHRAQIVSNLTGGQMGSARSTAETYLREARNAGAPRQIAMASFLLGHIRAYQGALANARAHLEEGLEIYGQALTEDVNSGGSLNWPTYGTALLALVCWQLGEVERAQELIQQAKARADELRHGLTLAVVYALSWMLEALRGDAEATLHDAKTLAGIELPLFSGMAKMYWAWARARLGDHEAGAEELRLGLAEYVEKKALMSAQLFRGLLAELEAEGASATTAAARIEEALALAAQTGQAGTDAFLHRIRGDILLRTNPDNRVPAEEAYRTAIAVAREQGARAFELRAAFALAKLYQSTGRPAEAHAVLAPALEGFAPTPEMPEIAEAQALLAALAQTDEVKAQAAQRQRLTQLHAAYGNALIAARGHGAPETIAAFARARKSASGDEDAPGRFAADYGLWVGSFVRGDLPSMRTHAAAFLAGVAARPDSPEAGVAHRVLGTTHWFAGEYAEAREHLERALTLFQPGRDDDLAFRFGQDSGVTAMCYLAIASWPLGKVRRAVSLVDGAHERLSSVAHIGTHPYAKLHAAMFELMRGDRARAAENGSETARLAREHDLPLWRAYGAFFEGLATAERGALGEGLSDMRRSAESLRQQNLLNFDGLFKIALAEAEARAGDRDGAIAILDEALAICDRLGYRAFEADLHRARGEILLQRYSANPAPAEDAFLTAIAIAKQQGTRSFELRAALSLAKLYRVTARPADAHAILAPALKDFAPTPEFPEIAEAMELVAAIKAAGAQL